METAPLDPPIHVDWLEPADLGDGRGRLGMTILPGKHGPSVLYPGRVYRRDLDTDIAALRAAGIGMLVLLVEDRELERWGDLAIVARAAEAGLIVKRHPMPDGTAPPTAEDMDTILGQVNGARADGDVAVACMGGVGRTGTVAACALVAAGWTAESAIDRVREIRHPAAVETDQQMGFVQSYERHVASTDTEARVAR